MIMSAKTNAIVIAVQIRNWRTDAANARLAKLSSSIWL